MAERKNMHVSNIKHDRCLERRLLPCGFGCPLCPNFKTESDKVIQRHLRNHTTNAVHFQDYIICSCNLSCRLGGHFHCPFCDNTLIRKGDMMKHLTECKKKSNVVHPMLLASLPKTQPLTVYLVPSASVDQPYLLAPPVSSQTSDHSYALTASPKTPTLSIYFDQPTPITTSDQPVIQKEDLTVPSTHIKCPYCPMILSNKDLVLHIKRTHSQLDDVTASSHLKSLCIDQSNGIYAVRKTPHGFSVPIHVQRKTWGQQHHTKCEIEDCCQYHLLVQHSGLSHSMCHHIRSVDYCSTMVPEEPLQHQVLEEMVENNFLGYSMVDVCKRRQREAEEARVPLSVFLDLSGSENHICFSIYEPELYHYSTLGRVIVTYNIKKDIWHCPCAKAHASCTHKYIAKWHLFQKHKHLFMTAQLTTASQSTPQPPTTDLERAVKYVFKSKRIPATLPEEATAQRALTEYSRSLFPDETTCQLCPDNPKLEEATQVTNKARIVGMQGVIQNISTYNRQCSKCKMVYRYQEWRDGLHNFNDHLILTLQLCVCLRHNLQNHVSVSRVLNSLESLLRVNFPATDFIFQGYCHFDALSNTEYKYSGVNGGFYPPDAAHRKGLFSSEVGELEQPNDDFHGEHNIVSFWESVHLHTISRGFFESPSQNPFVVNPTYENWALWIGEETHKGNTVLNTEFEKEPLQRSTSDPQLGDVTEDRLVDELLKQKLSTIQKLCKTCNLDTKGSQMDLINRLRGEMKSRQTYDKVFQSIWGAPVFPADVQQMVVIKEEVPEEWESDEDQQDHNLIIIKKEEEEIWPSVEEEHLCDKGTSPTRLSFTPVPLKSEDDEEKPLLSHLHQHHPHGDLPTSSSADQMIVETGGEDCGGTVSVRSPDVNTHEDDANSSETEVSEDDEEDVKNPDSKLKPLSDSGSETEDSDSDLKESRASGSVLNTVGKSFSCSECGKRFVSDHSLQRHGTSHSRSSSLNNSECLAVKENVDLLKKVKKRLKSFHCDDCGKKFTRKTNLNTHKTIHRGEKPFDCHVCRQSFSRKGNLNTHMRTHTGQKPFGCDVCGQSFSQKVTLDKHMTIHTGQKPFDCDFCGLSFSQKATLSRHIKVHTGDKPYVCDVCEQRFSRNAHLSTHMRTHTGDKAV